MKPTNKRKNTSVQKKKFYQLNHRIEAEQLRVIDEEGNQLGVLRKEEALKQAKAKEADLVLIAAQADPPVARIIDFKKFLYQQEKKQKEAKKGIKKSFTKDIKLSLFIGKNDLDRLLNKGREFLEEGSQVRINLTMKGREVIKRDRAVELVKQFIIDLGEVNVAKEPRVEGRVVRAVVSRKK